MKNPENFRGHFDCVKVVMMVKGERTRKKFYICDVKGKYSILDIKKSHC